MDENVYQSFLAPSITICRIDAMPKYWSLTEVHEHKIDHAESSMNRTLTVGPSKMALGTGLAWNSWLSSSS